MMHFRLNTAKSAILGTVAALAIAACGGSSSPADIGRLTPLPVQQMQTPKSDTKNRESMKLLLPSHTFCAEGYFGMGAQITGHEGSFYSTTLIVSDAQGNQPINVPLTNMGSSVVSASYGVPGPMSAGAYEAVAATRLSDGTIVKDRAPFTIESCVGNLHEAFEIPDSNGGTMGVTLDSRVGEPSSVTVLPAPAPTQKFRRVSISVYNEHGPVSQGTLTSVDGRPVSAVFLPDVVGTYRAEALIDGTTLLARNFTVE